MGGMAPPLVPGASAEGPPEPGAAAVGAGMFWLGTGQEGSHGSAAKQFRKSQVKCKMDENVKNDSHITDRH
jgi:hypothetical protein